MNKYKILHIGLCVEPMPGNGMQKAFRENSSEYMEINSGEKDLNRKVVELTKSFKPDIVFMQVQQAGIIYDSVVKHLNDIGAVVYNWNGDIRHETPAWMVSLGEHCHTLFSNMRDVHFMRSKGLRADWLEIGYDPERYNDKGSVNNSVKPIVFFGNNVHSFPLSGLRNQMCALLKAKYGQNFGLYGMAQGSDGNFNHSQYDEAAAYRNTKIAINLSHFEVEKYTSDRMYRILGTGTPICLAKWFPGIDEMFTDGVHLRMWRDLNELTGLIEYYMNPVNQEERQKIAHQGMLHAQKNYTFDAMVKNLIKIHENR